MSIRRQPRFARGLRSIARQSYGRSLHVGRALLKKDERQISDYLSSSQSPKCLQIGTGNHLLIGWLNTDLYSARANVVHLDATRRFPFEDEKFDFVYSEHMIEHIPLEGGISMLEESYRVLKRGGVMRLATPDFSFLHNLYSRPDDPLHSQYVEWSIRNYLTTAPYSAPIFVINNFVRDWGHQFIYDEPALSFALTHAGFENVKRQRVSESDYEPLRGIENVSRMPSGYLELESVIVEALKPERS